MRNLLYLLPVCFLVLLTSCGDDTAVLPEPESTDMNITFRAMFGDQPLDFNSTMYDYEGMDMTISKFDFYISNVALYKNVDGVKQETELLEIDFIDLTQNNNEVTLQMDDIPVGEYDGLVFSIGVPSDLNSQIPGDFSSTHPLGLSNTSHYWEGWQSYIFSKLEGKLDTGEPDPASFSYHTGSDDFYRSIEKNFEINLKLGETESLEFDVDIQSLLLNGGALDIQAYPSTHNISETTAATHIVNNYLSSINLN